MSRRDNRARLTVPVGPDDHSIGREDAPLTLVEYGDFQCPHCGRAYPIVKEVQRRLGTQLRFVFRHFPLTMIHPEAEHAAEAAEAAGAQRAFWPMHDRLFERQFALDDDHLVEYANELGLDGERIRGALAAGTYTPKVRDDFMSGIKSGANGTPTFYINGTRHDGGYDLESLLAALGSAASVPAG
jgi:protein-disulfide isomerase